MSRITTVENYQVGYGTGADDLNSPNMRMTDTPGNQVLPERRQTLKKLQRPRYEMSRPPNENEEDEDIDEQYEQFVMQELLKKGDPYAKMVVDMQLKELNFDYDYLDDFVVALFGRRRLGKTFGARWICYNLRNRFPLVVVITNTVSLNY